MKAVIAGLAVGLMVSVVPLEADAQEEESGRIGLQELIKAVTEELHAAAADRITEERPGLFTLGEVTLELSFVASREIGATGGIRFWVIEAGTEARFATESVQRVTVVLDPVEMDDDDLVLFMRRQAQEAERERIRPLIQPIPQQ